MVKNNKKIKMLVVQSSSAFGGAENQLLYLLEGLKKEDIFAYVLTNLKQTAEMLSKIGIGSEIINFPKEMSNKKNFINFLVKWPFLRIKIRKILKRLKAEKGINLAYLASFNEHVAVTRPTKNLGLKVVWMEHGNLTDWYKSRNPIPFFLYRKAAKLVDFFISPSESARKGLIKHAGTNIDKSKVVINGISVASKDSLEDYHKEGLKIRDKMGWKDNFIVSLVSRLSPFKGQEQLIRAIKLLKDKGVMIYCFIVGSGPYEDFLKGLTKKLGLDERIKFLGFLGKERFYYIAASDVFCLPTLFKQEGLPLVLLEAMSCGKPIVASNIGGIPEAVIDNESGMLIEPGNVEKLAEAIEHLYRNKSLGKKFGEKGRAMVENKFNANKMIKETKRILEKAII